MPPTRRGGSRKKVTPYNEMSVGQRLFLKSTAPIDSGIRNAARSVAGSRVGKAAKGAYNVAGDAVMAGMSAADRIFGNSNIKKAPKGKRYMRGRLVPSR